MNRKLLIIHESKLARKIAASYAQAEFSDLAPVLAAKAEEGLTLLAQEKFDLILSAKEMAGLDGVEIFKRIRQAGPNKETPFIIVTSTRTQAQKELLAQEGLEHILFSPYSGQELADVLLQASNPREKRASARYSIPGARAVLHLPGGAHNAQLVNISRQGVLCEFKCPEDAGQCLGAWRMDVFFPEEYDSIRINDILSTFLRLNALSLGPDLRPDVVRSARKFIEISPEAAASLDAVLAKAEKFLTQTEE